jgi:hypothetical protein
MIGTHGPGPFAGGKNSIRPRPLKTVSCALLQWVYDASLEGGEDGCFLRAFLRL